MAVRCCNLSLLCRCAFQLTALLLAADRAAAEHNPQEILKVAQHVIAFKHKTPA